MKSVPNKGYQFTFMEVMFVLLIVVVVIAVVLPGMRNVRSQSQRATCEYNLLTLGMALQTYAHDHDVYPASAPLIAKLRVGKYISSAQDFTCPLDTSPAGDTYSVGYIGGHPRTIRYNDPLIVCGWHPRIGTLAVYSDTMVMPLHERQNAGDVTAAPLTITHGGAGVDPGLVLHDTVPLVVETDSGDSAMIYGDNGSYFISATYDPLAYGGAGEFIVFIGYDLAASGKSTVKGSSANHIRFHTSLLHCQLTVVTNPSGPWTKITWNPPDPSDPNETTNLKMQKTEQYFISHIITGEYDELTIPAANSQYDPDKFFLNPK